MISKLRWINVALRALMEAGIVIAMGFFGYHFGKTFILKIVFVICLPLLVFGFWGAVDFRSMGKRAETFRLVQELVISALASVAFYLAGKHLLCWILAGLSIVHHVLVYALGDRLLKDK